MIRYSSESERRSCAEINFVIATRVVAARSALHRAITHGPYGLPPTLSDFDVVGLRSPKLMVGTQIRRRLVQKTRQFRGRGSVVRER